MYQYDEGAVRSINPVKIYDELKGSKVFWLQKAIGWVLREYSKTDPVLVEDFVRENDLAPLSRREALKVIERKSKQ